MKIAITNQTATLAEPEELVQNSENIYKVEFEFDDSWNGFAKTVIFQVGYKQIAVALVGESCNIPAECLTRPGAYVNIGVYGSHGNERKPTVWCKTGPVLLGAALQNGTVAIPTPDVYLQLLEQIEVLKEMIEEIPGGGGGGDGNVFSNDINKIRMMELVDYNTLAIKDPKTLYMIRG